MSFKLFSNAKCEIRPELLSPAPQFVLDRSHPNRLVFVPEQGLDPTLDLALASAELRTLIQALILSN